jgi:peptide deformylase
MFPDERLTRPALPVTAFDDTLASLITDLADTMRAAPGVGITAPHIGVLLRVVVLQLRPDEPQAVYINPVITAMSGPVRETLEGSVSMPGISAEVERPDAISFTYQTPDGTPVTASATGFLSVCLQHEVDQLDGLFWLHRLSRLKRDRLIRKYGKQQGQ